MRFLLQFVAAATLIAGSCAAAQITSPDKLVAPLPRSPAAHPAVPANDLQWLWSAASANDKGPLLADHRFQDLLDDTFRAPQAFWSAPGTPLADAARAFLGGPGTVRVTANRMLTITGCVIDKAPDADTVPCAQRGLLAVDAGGRDPLLVFAALRWNERGHSLGTAAAPYTLWLFTSRPLPEHRLPQLVRDGLASWLAATPCAAGTITSVIAVDPDGIPHILGALEALSTTAICTQHEETRP